MDPMRTTRQVTTAEIRDERERAARAHAERQADAGFQARKALLAETRERLRRELGREPTRMEFATALKAAA